MNNLFQNKNKANNTSDEINTSIDDFKQFKLKKILKAIRAKHKANHPYSTILVAIISLSFSMQYYYGDDNANDQQYISKSVTQWNNILSNKNLTKEYIDNSMSNYYDDYITYSSSTEVYLCSSGKFYYGSWSGIDGSEGYVDYNHPNKSGQWEVIKKGGKKYLDLTLTNGSSLNLFPEPLLFEDDKNIFCGKAWWTIRSMKQNC